MDLEFFWGRDSGYAYSDSDRRKYALVHEVVKGTAALFEKYDICATWATVGIAAADSLEELELFSPVERVSEGYPYANNYRRYNEIWESGKYGDWLQLGGLMHLLKHTKGQEIGSHTFAHIFCNEQGVSVSSIMEDIHASKRIFKEKFGIDVRSLVFPYNQIPKLEFLDLDIDFIRTDNPSSIYKNFKISTYRTPLKRILRWLDRFINITGLSLIHI